MKPDKVISAVESTIVKITGDIKKKKGNVGCDKINSLSKLINSYNRLVERAKDNESEGTSYYDKMERGFNNN